MDTHQRAKLIASVISSIIEDRFTRHPKNAHLSLEEVIAVYLVTEVDAIVDGIKGEHDFGGEDV